MSCVLLNLSVCLFETTFQLQMLQHNTENSVFWDAFSSHQQHKTSSFLIGKATGARGIPLTSIQCRDAGNSSLHMPPTPWYLANRTQRSTHLTIMWMGPSLKSTLCVLDSSLFKGHCNPLQKKHTCKPPPWLEAQFSSDLLLFLRSSPNMYQMSLAYSLVPAINSCRWHQLNSELKRLWSLALKILLTTKGLP